MPEKGVAGMFVVDVFEDGSNSIVGPKDYMAQMNSEKILSSVQLYMRYSDAPVAQLIAVALQTDYAGYLGVKQTIGVEAMLGGRTE